MKFAHVAAIALVAVLMNNATARADEETRGDDKPSLRADDTRRTPLTQMPQAATGEPLTSEVAGIRIVPSIMVHDVYLKPSAWVLRSGGTWANADAKVFQNRDGAITGLSLTAWGLPETTRYNEPAGHYVVWLVNRETRQVLNIGELDAYNRGKAIFGFTPLRPVTGYDAIAVTQERSASVTWPGTWHNLEADLPRSAALPPPIEPIAQPPRTQDQTPALDERRGLQTGPLMP